MEQSPDNA
jgi:hypothetical protein